MKNFLHILCTMGLVLLLFGCSGGPRVIPRGKMAKIYAEMLVTDQWIMDHPREIGKADTSLVYEPILQKYGYTSADYRASVERYMDDPERYSRILRETSDLLGKKLEELNALKVIQEKAIVVIKTNFRAEDYFPYLRLEPFVHYYDSLVTERDTLGCFRIRQFELSDTTYDGIQMIIKTDTLSVKDTVVLDEVVQKIDKSIHKSLDINSLNAATSTALTTTMEATPLKFKKDYERN